MTETESSIGGGASEIAGKLWRDTRDTKPQTSKPLDPKDKPEKK